jgi:SMI1 / KNR4 family (SUKH-1)
VLNVSIDVEVRALFPAGVFGAPCTDLEIAAAERALGHKLPPILKDLYRSFDGFIGPTDAQFLYPLLKPTDTMKTSLVEHTQFLRSEDYFPQFLQRSVAIGDTGIGPCWIIEIDRAERILWWDAEWGDEYEVVPGTLIDAWHRARDEYARLLQRSK